MKKQTQNDVDIVGFLTRIQEQLAALDKKLENLIPRPQPQSRPAAQPAVPAQPQGGGHAHDHQKNRTMYQAVCADCKKDCEVPFKPTGDRPVYCQECFRRRKAANNVKAVPDSKPQAATAAQTVITPTGTIQAPAVKDKKRPVAARKPAAKKRPAPKKKK